VAAALAAFGWCIERHAVELCLSFDGELVRGMSREGDVRLKRFTGVRSRRRRDAELNIRSRSSGRYPDFNMGVLGHDLRVLGGWYRASPLIIGHDERSI
jgi:hypothetical protein